MTSDVHEFIGWVGTLHAGGGGDIPEDQLDALAYAASFPFRPEAQGIIILVTDAPPHHAGDGSPTLSTTRPSGTIIPTRTPTLPTRPATRSRRCSRKTG